jgi:glycine/D-amino acid oxidase-like deaminating enzyme
LNPAKYVDQLAGVACRAGARLVEDTAVQAIDRDGSHWKVTTSRGSVQARDVLVATNGYTNGAAPWLQRRLVPIGSHIIATEPLDRELAGVLIPRRRMVFDSNYFLHYYRLSRDNRVFFGGRAEFGKSSSSQTRRCVEILRRDLVAIFPSLAETRIEYAWSGNVAFTRDQLPHAGQLDGRWYAGGYCGHGVAMGTYLGATIARRMAGESFSHPLVDRDFPAIPLYRGTPWFLPAVGVYYKFLDWIS